MKFRAILLGLAVLLASSLIMTGCGSKGTVAEKPAKSQERVASKSTEKPVDNMAAKAPNEAEPNASSGAEEPQQVASPFSGETSKSAPGLDSILNPQANRTAVTPLNPSAAGGISLDPAKRPTAKQVLMGVQARYTSAKTLRAQSMATTTMKADGKLVGKSMDPKSEIIFKRPNKIVLRMPGEEMITDGKTIYRYIPSAKRYTKTKMDSRLQSALLSSLINLRQGVGSIGLLYGADYASAMSSIKLLPDSKVNGVDTYVLSLKPKMGDSRGMNVTQTLWIGKNDLLIYKSELFTKAKLSTPKGNKGKTPRILESNVVISVKKCSLDSAVSDSEFHFRPPAGVKPIENALHNTLQGKPAPDFTFTWTDGTKKKLSDFRGKVVILDFWGLPVCEKHLPTLQSLGRDNSRIQVISVCLNSATDKVKQYLKQKSLDFPTIYVDENLARFFAENYHLTTVPTIFVIDGEGVVKLGMIGMPTKAQILAKVQKAVPGG